MVGSFARFSRNWLFPWRLRFNLCQTPERNDGTVLHLARECCFLAAPPSPLQSKGSLEKKHSGNDPTPHSSYVITEYFGFIRTMHGLTLFTLKDPDSIRRSGGKSVTKAPNNEAEV
ncbi:hypothetical protein JTE90_015491 [Oedothorax gibbosus]|uniref:Uncharacterized protein n=1 Tax=Oedothorax gibbosus TaxID=931172 RepID=A0AAV6VPT4_9ARAC|nr:hypothetical protein JTE90_015491 [Oedothorax gibbosus]